MKIVEKPWGKEYIWAITPQYAAKVLEIQEGHQLSLQYHEVKKESIFVETGLLLLILEDEKGILQEHLMSPGDAKLIEPHKKHRMIAKKTCRIFEVSTPELDDVVRIQDAYGRS
jgi:quercetin dioxygenase-like cupin family protein